jgi:hypothetical protein
LFKKYVYTFSPFVVYNNVDEDLTFNEKTLIQISIAGLPRSAHSLRSLKRSGVPGSGFPLWDSISKPTLKEATPLEFPEHGSKTLKTTLIELNRVALFPCSD